MARHPSAFQKVLPSISLSMSKRSSFGSHTSKSKAEARYRDAASAAIARLRRSKAWRKQCDRVRKESLRRKDKGLPRSTTEA